MDNLNIFVSPVPNGHTLSVSGNDYMYFTPEALLEGFMYHVGLKELEAVDAETIREFLTAAIVWKDNGETVKELVKARKENAMQSRMIENLKKQVESLKRQVCKLKDEEKQDS